ncbi:hypothetical protein F5890DRAFT_1556266 [Lentinula detonsa]|uniref:Uncharacterized protein n=1 Tax=Lentinula detonsa TaxID=2804962 RepID=A0AA38PUQ1_9AGAR|nr:hypothetical protein F5890DRAFT_1556266 [Lentinula detonsa]
MDLNPNFITRLKDTTSLTPEMREILDNYLQAPTLAERLAIHFTQTLTTQSLLHQLIEEKNVHWEVSAALKKLISKYAKAYILSSMIKFYIKCAPEQTIVSALRASRVRDLPGEDDVTANSTLKSAASRALVTARAQVKDHIITTTAHAPKGQLPADQRDLGTLRNVIDNSCDLTARDFWPQVDSEMANLLGVGHNPPKSQQAVLADFQLVYRIDTDKYGSPRVAPTNIGDPNYQWNRYVKNINTLASNATISESGEVKGKQSGKRKRHQHDIGHGRKRASADGHGSDADSDEGASDEDDQA